MTNAYAASGVDTNASDSAVSALVAKLSEIALPYRSRSVVSGGHYAAVLEVASNLGIAFATDGVGSKLVVAEQCGRYDTVGIDCIAMNVNDIICVGAKPIALVDYIAVEEAHAEMLSAIGDGLKVGAELAQIEIPGGEVAVLPEMIRGHPSPNGFDLAASCIGTVALDKVVTGSKCQPGDCLIGLPSSGLHSNGYSLARKVLLGDDGSYALDDRPAELGGKTIADALLEPTTIYVQAINALLTSDVGVHGLAHITGGGLKNLLRLQAPVGYRIEEPLPVTPVFNLIAQKGNVPATEMWEVFNMGCGFCVVVPADAEQAAVDILAVRHPGARRVGSVTDSAGQVEIPSLNLVV